MIIGTPPAEVQITPDLVRELLREQFSDLAPLPVRFHQSGWDNELFRVGDDWLARLPRRVIAATLIWNEQQWLPKLAESLPLAVPVPAHIGQPSGAFPWYWSIVPWIQGENAFTAPLPATEAERFADFLRALHVPAPADAPRSKVRGVPLQEVREGVEKRLYRLKQNTKLITPAVEAVWERALAAPPPSERRWVHGDLHHGNLLVDGGRLVAVIDWGDINGGDVACDLGAFWIFFPDPTARRQAIEKYGPIPDALLHRAMGWAVLFGAMSLEIGMAENSPFAGAGQQTLQAVSDDRAGGRLE